MNQVQAKILQQSYLLACKPGQEERLLEAVRVVDDAMTRIHDAGKVRARERIAVLAALNLAFELADLRQAMASMPQPTQTADNDKATESAALAAIVARLDAVLAAPAPAEAGTPAQQTGFSDNA
ncbi:hypothetical protein AAV94_12315 [Lampropedia cohaerens]|uniref:Cell division protein ZapA n=1 Tax=Lampropedia cohaerens TaxID=1610491 RepID=A0A0U1PXE4_9BURK|nr:cell division protein ZapA [Lampropedia cohaerens]KKW67107.1 hypothetical protein AAV94_12315 [Lampropedia cohaerens]